MRTHNLGVSKFPRLIRYNTNIDYLVPPFTWSITPIIQFVNFLKYFKIENIFHFVILLLLN